MRNLVFIIFMVLISTAGCAGSKIPTPQGMPDSLCPGNSPLDIISCFEGVPYRGDGAVNRFGEFTLFADQNLRFSESGLNCSGFTVAASRYLFDRNLYLNDMTIDRLGDSGEDSPYGQDWDFGYDLVLNVTEGMERSVLLPFGRKARIDGSNGNSLRGFQLHDRAAWKDIMSRMEAGKVYLFSMSKPVSFKKYRLLHYHVGLIVLDDKGHIWLCHATTKGGVNKSDITDQSNLERIINANPDSHLGPRKILIIEVPSRAGGVSVLKSIAN